MNLPECKSEIVSLSMLQLTQLRRYLNDEYFARLAEGHKNKRLEQACIDTHIKEHKKLRSPAQLGWQYELDSYQSVIVAGYCGITGVPCSEVEVTSIEDGLTIFQFSKARGQLREAFTCDVDKLIHQANTLRGMGEIDVMNQRSGKITKVVNKKSKKGTKRATKKIVDVQDLLQDLGIKV
jgi:hypothetical protein